MKLKLKDFQEDYTDKLVMALRMAARESCFQCPSRYFLVAHRIR